MAKKDEEIISQKRGRNRVRSSSVEVNSIDTIKESPLFDDKENTFKETATDELSEAVLELESIKSRTDNSKQTEHKNNSIQKDKEQKHNKTSKKSEGGDEAEENDGPVTKTLSFALKIMVFVVLVIIVITCAVVYKQNRDTDAKYAKIEEYSRYIDGYFQVTNEGSMDLYEGYFTDKTRIAEEYEYFQDGVYQENARKLITALLSTLSVEYNTTSNGTKDVSDDSNVMISHIDFEEFKEFIYNRSKDIRTDVKNLKTGTPKDRQLIKNYIMSNMADYIGECTTRVQESAIITVYKDKKTDKKTLDPSIDEKIYNMVLNTKDIEDIFNIYYDIIKKDIKDEDYTEYCKRMDKKYGSGKKTRDLFVESYIFDLDYKKENGISKIVGDGSLENPAAIGTEVESVYKAKIKNKKGRRKTKKCKILVSVDKAYIGEDAIAYANSLDSRNRGLSMDLTGTLMILDVSIKNMTKNKFTIDSNFGAVDEYGNLYYSTGEVYGMKRVATIKKYGTVKMQYYILCDKLDTKTAIYGADFDKKIPYVYFNVIQQYTGNKEQQ